MQPFIRFGRPRLRVLAAAAALCAVPLSALAGDVAPTPEGAQKLGAVLAQYLGKNATTVTPEGDHYAVAVDVAKLLAPLAAEGVSLDAAPAKADLTEQGDGAWRVTRDGYSPMTVHFKDGSLVIAVDDYKFDGVFDPAISGFRSADTKIGKAAVQLHAPEVDETIAVAQAHAVVTGAAAAGGGFSGAWREDINDISAIFTPKKKDPAQAAPAPVSVRVGGLSFGVALDNMRIRELLDLWAFFVAHPSRAELTTDEDGLKAKLRALIPLADKFDEDVAAQKLEIDIPKGPVELAEFKARFGVEKFPSKGDTEVHFAASGIAPPPGVAPPGLSDLVPTSIDLNVKYGGYDYAAAAEEAIDDIHLAGEGPIISEADRAKISAKMGAGPIVFTILPSRIIAAQLDLSLEGAFQVFGARPVGKVTLKAHNFDNTIAAIKGAGPQIATPQLLAALTLAKGLGKADADGSLTWVAEYGADGAIKVNGLALGKAPQQ